MLYTPMVGYEYAGVLWCTHHSFISLVMTTVNRVPLKLARATIGQLARRAHAGKEIFILESDGIPLAALLDVSELEDYLDTRDPKVRSAIKKSQAEYLAGKAAPARAALQSLVTSPTKPARKRGKARKGA